MKIVQEENLQPIEHQLSSRFNIDMMACLFFVLGMIMCGFILHNFVF